MQDVVQEDCVRPTWFSYTIEAVEGRVSLVRQEAIGEKPIVEAPDGGTISDIAIKVEDTDEAITSNAKSPASLSPSQKSTTAPQRQNHNRYLEAYNQVFGAFYNVPLCHPAMDISTALTYTEELIELASSLGCLHVLTSQIGNTLLQYRQLLFEAIRSDPARWILLACKLENDSIYTEAMIHLAGAHPCWPWPTKRKMLPEAIRRIIITKSRALDQMCLEAERELLLLTIQVHNGPVKAYENSQFDTWFIVATFRDNLARELTNLEDDKRGSLRRGKLFRKIFKAGSAYMDYEDMRRLLQRVMPSAVDSLSEDLALLKEHASEYVKDLAKNELMLDVEANNVSYLTCTQITAEDIPWRAADRGT